MEEKLDNGTYLEEKAEFLREKLKFQPRTTWSRRLKDYTVNSTSFASHATVFLVTSAIWALILFSLNRHRHLYQNVNLGPKLDYDLGLGHTIFAKRRFIGCGYSIEEAKRHGCEFDILSNHYLPKQCKDDYSIAQYQKEGTTWIGYTDKNWTNVLPSVEAMGESDTYWTNQRDHIVHCAMLWRRQWRAFSENWRYFDAIIADAEHTEHCAQFLVDMTENPNSTDWRRVPISVEVGFAGCIDRAQIDDKSH